MAMIVLTCAAVRSVGSPVPAPAARPLVVDAAMSASLAFVTALSAMTVVATPSSMRPGVRTTLPIGPSAHKMERWVSDAPTPTYNGSARDPALSGIAGDDERATP